MNLWFQIFNLVNQILDPIQQYPRVLKPMNHRIIRRMSTWIARGDNLSQLLSLETDDLSVSMCKTVRPSPSRTIFDVLCSDMAVGFYESKLWYMLFPGLSICWQQRRCFFSFCFCFCFWFWFWFFCGCKSVVASPSCVSTIRITPCPFKKKFVSFFYFFCLNLNYSMLLLS